jgi:hypothetical protein
MKASHRTDGVRPITVLLCLAVIAGTAGLAVGASEPRSEPAKTSPPVTVYVSETLDISNVELTGYDDIDDDPITLRLADGNATVRIDDPTNASFDGVQPGEYYVESDTDREPDLRVVEPRVTRLRLQSRGGENVTDRTVRSLSALIVRAEYDFDNADRLDVTIRGPDGVPIGLNPRSARITESGGRMSVLMATRPPGTYTVVVEGSDIDAGRRTATVTVRGEPTPTPTSTPTPTGTPTPTTTASPTPTETPPPTPTSTPAPTPPSTATAVSPPTQATETSTRTAMPADGFGPGLAVAVLLGLVIGITRRRR